MVHTDGLLPLAAALYLALSASAQTYSATYLPSNAPKTTENGQSGTNQCGTGSNQTSMCQNAYINSVDDWCLWAPPSAGADSSIGNTERIEVAWCLKSGYGTRLIPDGAIKGAHFVQTPDFVQITGIGDLTLLNIVPNDPGGGGELDPHGADGNGNPVGGLVFSSAFGQLQQLHEWTNFMSDAQFCFRACKEGPKAPAFCQHIYDVMGCDWNMPANYSPDVFEQCQGDSGEPMGVYGASTFHQGDAQTPAAHPIPSSSSCTTVSTVGNSISASGSSTGSASATTTGSNSATSTGTGSSRSTSSPTSSGSSGASQTSAPNAGSSLRGSVAGWEQLVLSIGSSMICSMLGAVLLL